MSVKKILASLKAAAAEGREKIERGDSFRHEVEDEEFRAIVPPRMENRVIEAMVFSGEWERVGFGFNFRGVSA